MAPYIAKWGILATGGIAECELQLRITNYYLW